jgi:hypothetical protein
MKQRACHNSLKQPTTDWPFCRNNVQVESIDVRILHPDTSSVSCPNVKPLRNRSQDVKYGCQALRFLRNPALVKGISRYYGNISPPLSLLGRFNSSLVLNSILLFEKFEHLFFSQRVSIDLTGGKKNQQAGLPAASSSWFLSAVYSCEYN